MPVQIGAPTIQGVDTSLSEALSTWATQLQQEQSIRNMEAARQAGLKTEIKKDEQGKSVMPETKERRFFGSKTAEQYNQGVRDAYILSVDRDNTQEVSRIAQESDGNLDKFDTIVEQYKRSTLKSIDPLAADEVRMSLEDMIARSRLQVQNLSIRKTQAASIEQRQSAYETYGDEALRLVRNGDLEGARKNLLKAGGALDSMVLSGDISQAKADELINGKQKEVYLQAQKKELFDIADQNMQEAYDALDDIAGKVPENFSPDEWDSFISSAQTDLNRKQARQARITEEDRKQAELNASIQRGLLFTNPEIPADPAKSSQDRKDVNNYYNAVSPQWQDDLNGLINKNVEFVKNTGIVPDRLISNMNATMRSGGDNHVLAMMETMQRIQETSPNSLRDLPDESRAMSLQVSDSIRNGMAPEDAIKAARENTYGLSESKKEEIRIATGKDGMEDRIKNLEKRVEDEFDPGIFWGGGSLFPGAPEIPPGMQASYLSNFKNMMAITNGNIELSEQLAYDSTKKVWGVSRTGGKRRFMQYAPESFYHVDGFDDSWVRDQFLEDMELAGIQGAVIGVDKDVPRSDQPSYPILAPNERGILDIVRDETGTPLRFKPDITQTEQYKELVDAPGKSIEKARQMREKKIKTRADVIRRNIMADIFAYTPGQAQIENKAEYLKTDEGKNRAIFAINNMLVTKDIDFVEAKEALSAFDAGLEDLPGYEIFLKKGLIRAAD